VIVAIIIVTVLVIAGAATVAAVVAHSSKSGSTSSGSTTTTTVSYDTNITTPVISGFQGVAVPSLGIAYDVPASWVVDPTSQSEGFGKGTPSGVYGIGATSDGEDYCPGSAFRTLTFIVQPTLTDPAAAATDVANRAAQLGYSTGSARTTSTPASYTARDSLRGQTVTASGSWTPSQPGCTTTTYSVYTFAFTGPGGALLVLTIPADRGTTGEVTPDIARQILSSVRKL
jgi:hypothetical protein